MIEIGHTDPLAAAKRAAAEAAVMLVETGMAIGLGTGSTAAFAVAALGRRVREERLSIVAIPTSERTAAQARTEGIKLVAFAECARLDLTIDGADEIARGSLDLIKGLGGALLREKLVAAASERLVIVADDGKLVDRLGTRAPVPVEVVAFGWETTAERLGRLGLSPKLRTRDGGADEGTPFVTDGGNLILDCTCGPIADAASLDRQIRTVIGVIESGLFPGMAEQAIVAGPSGVRTVHRGEPSFGSEPRCL